MPLDPLSLIKRKLQSKQRRNFLRDERGVTAVEFGLLAIPFFSILCAILETAVVFLAGQLLDSAVQDTSRFLRTGQMQAAKYDLPKFRTNLCTRLYGLFDCDKLFIDVQVLSSFNAANIKAPVDPTCTASTCPDWTRDSAYNGGAGSSTMVVQVYYRWPSFLNFAGVNLANMPNGVRILGAASVFRNEPFTGGPST